MLSFSSIAEIAISEFPSLESVTVTLPNLPYLLTVSGGDNALTVSSGNVYTTIGNGRNQIQVTE